MLIRAISLQNILIFRSVRIPLEHNLVCICGESGSGKSLLLNFLANSFTKSPKDVLGPFDQPGAIDIEFQLDSRIQSIRYEVTTNKIKLLTKNEILDKYNQNIVYQRQFGGLKLVKSEEQRRILDEFGSIDLCKLKSLIEKKRELIERANEYDSDIKKKAMVVEMLEKNKSLLALASLLSEHGYTSLDSLLEFRKKMIPVELLDQIESSLAELKTHLRKLYILDNEAPKISADELENYLFRNRKSLQEFNLNPEDVASLRFLLQDLTKILGQEISLSDISNLKADLENEIKRKRSELDDLKLELSQTEHSIVEEAKHISSLRLKFANDLTQTLNKILPELGFGFFIVYFDIIPKPIDIYGKDNIQIYVTFNKGIKPKPLAKVASGGEFNRFLLALTVACQKGFKDKVLIFDEIDSGLSGNAFEALKSMLLELSKSNQVIFVSHNFEKFIGFAQIIYLRKIHSHEYTETVADTI